MKIICPVWRHEKQLLHKKIFIYFVKHSFSCSGICELCSTKVEDLAHVLLPRCVHLQERRTLLVEYWRSIDKTPACTILIENALSNNKPELFVQFVLDCSVLPDVILAAQKDETVLPTLFKLTRTWCYSLHRTRLKLLGRWSH